MRSLAIVICSAETYSLCRILRHKNSYIFFEVLDLVLVLFYLIRLCFVGTKSCFGCSYFCFFYGSISSVEADQFNYLYRLILITLASLEPGQGLYVVLVLYVQIRRPKHTYACIRRMHGLGG
jgi:hypothetical protein